MAGGRKAKATAPSAPPNTLVLDNGAYTLKAGFVRGGKIDEPRAIPNCIARDRTRKVYVASELDKCRDFGEIQFRRPVEKGFVVNWEAQKEIWDHEFFDTKAPLLCDPKETRLLLGEPPNGLPVLQTNCDQIVFEEYGFASYYRGICMFGMGQDWASKYLPVEQLLPLTPTTTSKASFERLKTPLPLRILLPKFCSSLTLDTRTQP